MNLSFSKSRFPLQILSTMILIIGLLFSFSNPAHAQTPASGPNDPDELSAFVDGVMATSMQSNHVPGAVVVVVKDGEVFFAKGYGYADLDNKTPVDPATTLFRPGSVSKLFTWTAVMQLVEAGKLDLDTDVNTYLDFEIPATYPEPITLRSILTHRTGFEDVGDGLFKVDFKDVSSLETYVKEKLPARVFPSGQYSAYSNYSSALSGYIIERVTGMPFEKYIASNILEPLHMQNSNFEQPLPAKLSGKMSKGYNFLNGEYIEGSFEYVVGSPAGALSATGLDMANFMIAHLQGGQFGESQILSVETAQLMHSPLYSPDPDMGGMTYGFFYNTHNGQYTLSHGGDTMLFHSQMYLLPESNVGIFVSTNGTAGDKVAEDLINSFIDRCYTEKDRMPISSISSLSSRANQYAGNYYMARSNSSTFEKIQSLMSPMNVHVKGELVYVKFRGKTIPYVEVKPGLLENPNDAADKLALNTIGDQISLSPPMPFDFLKTPWYRSIGIHLFILGGGAILFPVAMISWFINYLRNLKNNKKQPVLIRLTHWSGVLFGLTFIFQIATLIGIFASRNPAFGVPNAYIGLPTNRELLTPNSYLTGGFGLAFLIFTLIAWFKKYSSVKNRVFFSLLAIWASAILWSLYFWNLFL